MKYVILISFLAISVVESAKWKPKQPAELFNIQHTCIERVKLPEEYVPTVLGFTYPNHPKVHEYVRCAVKNLGLFDDKKGYNNARLTAQFGQGTSIDKAKKIVNGCTDRNPQKSSPTEWAYRNAKCITDSELLAVIKQMVHAK